MATSMISEYRPQNWHGTLHIPIWLLDNAQLCAICELGGDIRTSKIASPIPVSNPTHFQFGAQDLQSSTFLVIPDYTITSNIMESNGECRTTTSPATLSTPFSALRPTPVNTQEFQRDLEISFFGFLGFSTCDSGEEVTIGSLVIPWQNVSVVTSMPISTREGSLLKVAHNSTTREPASNLASSTKAFSTSRVSSVVVITTMTALPSPITAASTAPKTGKKIGIGLAVVFATLLIFGIVFWLRRRSRQHKMRKPPEELDDDNGNRGRV